MPISIGELARARRTFSYPTEFGDVQVTYRPYQMTPARESEIARLAAEHAEDETDKDVKDTEQGLMKIVTQFCEVVDSTDMIGPLHKKTDPHTGAGIGEALVLSGEPIPIEEQYVRYFSSAFLVNILVAVAKDARPKKTRADS